MELSRSLLPLLLLKPFVLPGIKELSKSLKQQDDEKDYNHFRTRNDFGCDVCTD
jgi:hypothetical protein